MHNLGINLHNGISCKKLRYKGFYNFVKYTRVDLEIVFTLSLNMAADIISEFVLIKDLHYLYLTWILFLARDSSSVVFLKFSDIFSSTFITPLLLIFLTWQLLLVYQCYMKYYNMSICDLKRHDLTVIAVTQQTSGTGKTYNRLKTLSAWDQAIKKDIWQVGSN